MNDQNEEPWFNDLQHYEMLMDAAFSWYVFPFDWYEGDGPQWLETEYLRALEGDPED